MTATRSDRTGGRTESAPEDELSPREFYERVLRCVEVNTGGPETPMRAGARGTCWLPLSTTDGKRDREASRRVKNARAAAIKNEDLLPWKDRDGRVRYTCVTEEGLRDLLAEERQREDTCVELVERAEELLEEIEDA